jgi:hypothetical protein
MPRTATAIAIWRNRHTGELFQGTDPPPIEGIRDGLYDAFCMPDAECSMLHDQSDAPCYLMGDQPDSRRLRWYDREALEHWLDLGSRSDPDTRAPLGDDARNPARLRPVWRLTLPHHHDRIMKTPEYNSVEVFRAMALALESNACTTDGYAMLRALQPQPNAVRTLLLVPGARGPNPLCLWLPGCATMPKVARALVCGVLFGIDPRLRVSLRDNVLLRVGEEEEWRIVSAHLDGARWLALVASSGAPQK